jgi:DNA-binding MarR family transcriptional regulator
VFDYLYEHPIVSVKEVQDLIGTTYPAANKLVTRMVNCGVLHEFTGRARNRRFIYQSYIELFHDSGLEADA